MKQNGFTLIELMVTIVIIAILAGIAVPQYLAYTRRAEVAEMVALADIVKKKVGIFYSTKGRWPKTDGTDTNAEVGLDLVVIGAFGVRSNPDKKCFEGSICAALRSDPATGSAFVVADHRGHLVTTESVLTYTANTTSEAALTWSCNWNGESDFPGAKPDGCE